MGLESGHDAEYTEFFVEFTWVF